MEATNINSLDTSVIERYYRDFYISDTCTTACFQDNATTQFLRNENNGLHFPACGAANNDSNSIVHAIPVVLRFAGDPAMLGRVETAVRVLQNTDSAVAQALAAARILEFVRFCRMFLLLFNHHAKGVFLPSTLH